MEKSEFLQMFAQCVKDGDIKFESSVSWSECFGHRIKTEVIVSDVKVAEFEGDVDIVISR